MENKKDQKKAEIVETMKAYKDAHGNIDLTKLRQEMPKVYARIPYYFGSIDQALIEANGGTNGSPVNRLTLRNELAYDHLRYLREEKKMTLEEIGKSKGVTRAHVNQLYQSLSKTFGHTDDIVKELDDQEAE